MNPDQQLILSHSFSLQDFSCPIGPCVPITPRLIDGASTYRQQCSSSSDYSGGERTTWRDDVVDQSRLVGGWENTNNSHSPLVGSPQVELKLKTKENETEENKKEIAA